MAKNDFQYGGWNSYTLQCGMWLWNRDSEFTKWQHPAMWYVALGWHAIEFAQTSATLEFYISFPFPHITAVDMSFCNSLRNFIQIGPYPRQKKMTSCRFSRWRISAILDCRDPIMGSLKSPCTTSYSCVLESLLSQSCWLWYVTIQTHVFWKPVFEVFCQTPKTGIISIWLLCTDMY